MKKKELAITQRFLSLIACCLSPREETWVGSEVGRGRGGQSKRWGPGGWLHPGMPSPFCLPTAGSPSMSVTWSKWCLLREATVSPPKQAGLPIDYSTRIPAPCLSCPLQSCHQVSIDLDFVFSTSFTTDGKFLCHLVAWTTCVPGRLPETQ